MKTRSASLVLAVVCVFARTLTALGGTIFESDWNPSNTGHLNWSAPGNWSYGGVPVSRSGADATELYFGATGSQAYTAVDDIPGAFQLSYLGLSGNSSSVFAIDAAPGSSLTFRAWGTNPSWIENQNTGAGAVIWAPITIDSAGGNYLQLLGDGPGTLQLGGSIGGTGTIVKYGAATAILTGPNSYSGGTSVFGGKLSVGSDTGLGMGGVNVGYESTLDFLAVNPSVKYLGGDAGTQVVLHTGTTLSITGNVGVGYGGAIVGPGGLRLAASGGALPLYGANTYSGGTTVDAGTLYADSASALGTGGVNVNGGTLVYEAAGLTTGRIAIDGGTVYVTSASASAGQLTGSSGLLSLAAGSRLWVGSDGSGRTYSGSITGSGTLSKEGSGVLSVEGDNGSFTGTFDVEAGALHVNGATALGSGGAALTIGAGGTTSIYSNGAIVRSLNNSGTLEIAGEALTVDGGVSSGRITGSGGLIVDGGTLVLGGATSNYTGATVVRSGTLFVGSNAPSGAAGALGSATSAVALGDSTGAGNASLLTNGDVALGRDIVVQGGNTGTVTLGGASSGSSAFSGTITLGKDATLTAAAGGTVRFGSIVGAGGVTFAGAGIMGLTAANSYSGGTRISSGSVVVQVASSLGTGAVVVDGGSLELESDGAIASSARLTMNGGGVRFDTAAPAVGSLAGTGGSLMLPFQQTALTVGGDGTSTTFAGTIAGAGGLTKVGAGKLTLTGASTNTGATRVDGGALVVNGSLAGDVEVGAGALLGGHGSVGTLGGAGLVSPGQSPGIITAASIDPSLGMDFAFEFTRTGAPDYANAAASWNDVLRLTGATPFASALGPASEVDFYFDLASLVAGDRFTGGFYTNAPASFLDFIDDATLRFFVADASGSIAFNGQEYSLLADRQPGFTVGVRSIEEDALFAGASSPVQGYVTELVIARTAPVPEPATLAIVAVGAIAAVASGGRRRRRGPQVSPNRPSLSE